MHILYIHQHFAIPSGATGTRSYEFARRWAKAGHKVTLITGYATRSGLTLGRGLIQPQHIDGINVIVINLEFSNTQTFFRRVVSFLGFVLVSIYVGLKVRKVDVMYVTSTPLTVGVAAIILRWVKRVPFVFEVRDQWPEIPVQMGIIKNKLLIKILLWLERTIYRKSAAIVALSPGMAEGIRSVLDKDVRIVIIPNSADNALFEPSTDGSKLRDEKGWVNKLVLLYAGTMGMANGLDFVVDAAERLKSNADIHFVLIGNGRQKSQLARRITQSGLTNIELLDAIPKVQLPQLFAACDVSLVIFSNYPVLEHSSPNKFFDSLSAGRPVLLNCAGWQREVLDEYKAGLGCQLCNLPEFVENVQYLASHRKNLLEMGQNARRLAVEEFDRDDLALAALEVAISSAEGR